MGLFGPPNVKWLEDKRDVNGLIKALRYNDLHVRWGAAIALWKVGDVRAVEPLIAALKDEREEVREAAAQALGRIGDARAVGPLIAALKDASWEVQKGAAEALGQIGGLRAVEALIAAIKEKNGWYTGEEALKRINSPAVEPLILALPDIPIVAAAILGTIGDGRAVEPLIAALKDERSDVREAVVSALGWIRDARAVEPLGKALKDKNREVREKAAAVLGRIGGGRAAELLVMALQEDNEYFVEGAKSALNCIGTPAIRPLIEVIKAKGYYTRISAVEILENLGWKPDTDDQKAWYWAVKGEWDECVKLGEPALEPLIAAIDGNSSAAKALGQIGGERAVEPLIAAFAKGTSSDCEEIAPVLKDLYRSNKLTPTAKQKILAIPERHISIDSYDMACNLHHHQDVSIEIQKTNDDITITFT